MFEFKESLEAFYGQIPKTPTVLKDYPCLTTFANTAKQGQKLLKSFVKKGIFNAIPVGKLADDFLVMRLSPNGKSSFGAVSAGYPSGITLSPTAHHFLLSVLIFSDLKYHYFSTGDTEEVGDFAKQQGETEKTLQAFWEEFPRHDEVIGGVGARRGQIWELLGNITGDEFFSSIAKCWTIQGSELLEWATPRKLTENTFPILARAILGAKFYETAVDELEPEMRDLLRGDDIFDANYWGAFDGMSISRLEMRVSVASVKHLSQKYGVDPELADIWDALIAYSKNPEKYNGLKHLEVAKRIAEKDPILAFHLANIGSAFHRFNKGKRSREFFDFLKQLADAQGWRELQTVYGWMDAFV